MTGFVARRFFFSIPLLLAVSVLVFVIGRLLPGDPVALFLAAGDINDRRLVEQIRNEYGLNDPLPVQYVNWVSRAARGDLGMSIRKRQPVAEILWRALQNTGRVAAAAVVLVAVVGWGLGVISAVISVRGRSALLDRLFGLAPILMLSIPSFSLAVFLIYFLAIQWGLLPTGGMGDVRTAGVDLGDAARHMVLPTIALAWTSIGSNWRLARNTVIEVLREDYIRTAYAKGLREEAIFYVHALRNSMIPLLTSAGLLFGSLISGSFILEYLFSWPGIGQLMVDAVLYRDYPVVQGGTLLLAAIYLGINLLVDVTYALIDPRIRYG
ncbi:MAG TPA: ABC transporter permease [Chloroflexota bacterium]|jgi:ABC-type dipeptide/oligopeptide/nickel transport system permease component|nr:ABC transporter permease [Chloroflexota bacterium]